MKIVVRQAIINEPCEKLYLELNKISSVSAFILAQALNGNNTLKNLWLYDNQVSDTGVYYLAKVLSINNNILKSLDIGKNQITDEGAKHLAQMIITNITLTDLYLHENRIGDIEIQILANAIQHHRKTIKTLDL
jgi:Ran GTPase-activating protein (RanGAP) involved in mRNA processing and transport